MDIDLEGRLAREDWRLYLPGLSSAAAHIAGSSMYRVNSTTYIVAKLFLCLWLKI